MLNNFHVFEELVLFDLWIPDSGFRIPDSGFRIPDSGFWILVSGSGFRIPVPGSGFRLPGFRVAHSQTNSYNNAVIQKQRYQWRHLLLSICKPENY